MKVVNVLVHCSKGTQAIALKLGGFDLWASKILQVSKGQGFNKTGHIFDF